MEYKRIYDQLIEKRRNDPLPDEVYGEVHHIVPKSEGGTDDPDNLVRLSAREHFVAHLLLAKIYDDFNMWCAVILMGGVRKRKRQHINNRLYEKMRIEFGKRSGEAQRGMKRSEEFKRKVSIGHKGQTPWNKGSRMSREYRQLLSRLRKGKPKSREQVEKMAQTNRGHRNYVEGCHWWTDGTNNVFSKECPTGWKRGRTMKKEVA